MSILEGKEGRERERVAGTDNQKGSTGAHFAWAPVIEADTVWYDPEFQLEIALMLV